MSTLLPHADAVRERRDKDQCSLREAKSMLVREKKRHMLTRLRSRVVDDPRRVPDAFCDLVSMLLDEMTIEEGA